MATSSASTSTTTERMKPSSEKKRSSVSDSANSEENSILNATEKSKLQTLWLYLKSETVNLATFTMKNPKMFTNEISNFANEAVDFNSVKHFATKRCSHKLRIGKSTEIPNEN